MRVIGRTCCAVAVQKFQRARVAVAIGGAASRRRSTAQQLPPPAATGASADATPTPTRSNANADARKITAQLGRCRNMNELLQEFNKYRHELNPIHLSTFWMSVVRCAPPAHVLYGEELRPAREALLEQLPLFHGWAIANTAYALGKLGVGNAPAFEEAWEVLERIALAHITLARSGEVTEQGLSNLAWAFAKAERPVPQLFDAIAAEAARPQRRAKFVPQNLSNIVWAFAKANHDAPSSSTRWRGTRRATRNLRSATGTRRPPPTLRGRTEGGPRAAGALRRD